MEDIQAALQGLIAQGQKEGQGGSVIGGPLQHHEQQQTNNTHQTHVQEGGREAAKSEIAGGELAGLTQDLPKTGKHGTPVRHDHRRNQHSAV